MSTLPLTSPHSPNRKIIETDRLSLRRLHAEDAAFILELVNEPAWLEFIGDRGVRNLDDARAYIAKGPVAMYERCGFGLFLVARKEDSAPIGICGLLQRDTLPDVDLGFALLTRFRGQGYAQEAARATLSYGRSEFCLQRIVAVTAPGNAPSMRVLESLGFVREGLVTLEAGQAPLALWTS